MGNRSYRCRAISYDPEVLQLTVRFRDGSIYIYYGVSLELARRMASAPSKGGFIYDEIEFKHHYQRMSYADGREESHLKSVGLAGKCPK